MGMIHAPDPEQKERLERMALQYGKDLLRICFIYLRDYPTAEDAVQETFLKAIKSIDSFREASSEKTWLIRIAINCCRDYQRSAWNRHIDSHLSIDRFPYLPSSPPSDEHFALTAAIMKLKPKYKEVVLLYFYEGYSMKEIATMLDLTEGAVSIRITKAKMKLRQELEGGEENEK